MKILLSLLGLILLGGCMTPRARVPARATAPAATLEVHHASSIEYFTGYEARCEIQSIDGAPVDATGQLLPGNHTLTVSLSRFGREYIGDVDLIIPEAKSYKLKAKRKGEAFTLSIIDVASDKTIATSTAPLNERMKFLVFVVQQ